MSQAVCNNLNLENGHVDYNSSTVKDEFYHVGTVASFKCNDGYGLSGSQSSLCQASGIWDKETPKCDNEISTIY